MIRSDIDKTGIASDVVNAIGIRTRNVRTGKIVTLNLFGLLCRKPLLACVVVVANELFFCIFLAGWASTAGRMAEIDNERFG